MTWKVSSLFLVFTGLCFVAHAGSPKPPFLGVVAADKVNVRAGQNENFERLCQLKKDEEVLVVDQVYGWYKIKLPPSAKSYIINKYIALETDTIGKVTADRVNIRAGSGVNSTSLGQIKQGEKVQILEKLEGWYKILPIEESYGWIVNEFISFKSKDISGYLSKEKVLREEAAHQPIVSVEAPSPPPEPKAISLVGFIKPEETLNLDKVHYKIVVEGEPTYIEGMDGMLGDFVDCKVKVEGALQESFKDQKSYPVVVASKIQLVL